MSRRALTALALAAALALPCLLAGQGKDKPGAVRPPVEPSAPDVDIVQNKRRPDGDGLPVTVVTARGDTVTGVLVVPFDSLDIEAAGDGPKGAVTVRVADIDSIEFTRWAGKERRKNEFAFYHSAARITLKDKQVIECGRNIPALDRLVFRDEKRSRSLYSYFYDYLKNGAWKNSGETDIAYPETNPHADTLVRIIFLRKKTVNPLETILRTIQGELK
ncbi:MAG: hypothetical protein JW807_17185 [Spirochaetes bacterium]|nr:hypothetical protein [Spirochaetota bacterium]